MADSESENPDPAKEAAAEAMKRAASHTPPIDPLLQWEPPSSAELDEWLDGYDVGALVGRGGMGAVYRAVQKSLDRTVALKLLPEEFEGDPNFAERFEKEAKLLAQLNHPNIVQIYDFGRSSKGHWFFAMEFVEGLDFHQLIRSGKLETDQALQAVSQICDALVYAHGKGFVHRDIKPANIFIDAAGTVKIGDFGLAKIVDPESGDTESLFLTEPGTSMGTPFYCAPEQLSGGEVDQRADIYSLGVMFYEMLTGTVPQGAFELPSEKLRIDVRIDSVVIRAMAAEPELRYQTAGDVRSDVDEILAGPVKLPRSDGVREERALTYPQRVFIVSTIALLGAVVVFLSIRGAVDSGDGVTIDSTEPRGSLESAIPAENPGERPDLLNTFPLPLPEFPPKLPPHSCRLVILPLRPEYDSNLPDWLRHASFQESDRFADITSVLGDSLRCISPDGSPLNFGAPELRWIRMVEQWENFRVVGGASIPQTHAYLKEDGNLIVVPSSPMTDYFSEMTNVAKVRRLQRSLAILQRDGRLTVVGDDAVDYALNDDTTTDVVDIGVEITGSDLSVLKRDGSWIRLGVNRKIERWKSEVGLTALFSLNLAKDLNGEYANWHPSPVLRSMLAEFPSSRLVEMRESRFRGGLSLLRDDGFARCAFIPTSGSGGLQLVDPAITRAIQGAAQIKFENFSAKNYTHLLALLPADSVPRSGNWDVNELIAARETVRPISTKRQESR